MNYASLIHESCVDFTGWSTVVQTSHCTHMCHNCFNKAAWSKNYGERFTEETYQQVVQAASKPFISNIIWQGGDPLSPLNYKEVITTCRRLKEDLPDKNIVVFTGYTCEELQNDLLRQPILETIDYLMDGKYEHDNPTTKPFRGSDNQILHTLENGISISQN